MLSGTKSSFGSIDLFGSLLQRSYPKAITVPYDNFAIRGYAARFMPSCEHCSRHFIGKMFEVALIDDQDGELACLYEEYVWAVIDRA